MSLLRANRLEQELESDTPRLCEPGRHSIDISSLG